MADYSIYPDAIDGYAQLPLAVDNVTRVDAITVNRLRSAIINIERELGANPSGEDFDTVSERLDELESLLGGGGSSILINSAEVEDPNFNDDTPTAVSGANILWQVSGSDVSAYVAEATATTKGVVELATDGESAAGVVVQGNDSRLSDSRTTTGSAGGDLTGTYPNPSVTADAITNAKLANMAANTIKGSVAGGDPVDLTATQAKSILAITSSDVSDFTEAAQDATGAMVNASLTYTDSTPLLSVADRDFGDITTTVNGTTWTIDNDVVTYAKMQNSAAARRLLGNPTASTNVDHQEIALDDTLEFDGSNNLQRAALTGDVTASAGSNVTALASSAVLTATMFAQTLALSAVIAGGLLIGGTTEKYEILLAATPTTEATVVAAWDDITSSGFTSGTTTNVTNGASAVSIAGSPASSTKRLIKEVSVFNRAYLPIVATIRFYDGTNNRTVGVWRLNPDDVLLYSPRIGWHVTNKGVAVRRAGAVDDAPSQMVPVHGFPAILASSNKTHVSGDTVAVYLGEAEADFTQVKLRWATGATAAATITWAEIAVAYGDADLSSNPTLYLLGYTNIAAEVAVINSTYHSTIRASGHAGMKLWALLGMAATTLLVQIGSSADNLSTGVCATATVRPSAIPAAGTSFTVDGTNAIPRYMWEIN